MSIILTGSSGFVGTNILKKLNQSGIAINCLSLRDSQWRNKIIPQAKAIIHLAGKAHDLKKTTNASEYFDVNTKLTQELFDFFLTSDCNDFIFFSSVKAVTDNTAAIITERTITNPISAYGQSKRQAEQYILSQKLPQGKRVIIIRPSMIYGPGNKGNLNLLYKVVSKNIPWPLGAFENKRSYCSIDNLMFVINELIEREDIPSGIYNIADDEPLSTNQLIKLMAISQNRKPNVWKIPKVFINRLAKLGDIFYLPLDSERLQKLTESYVVSNHKIKNAIGKPLPVSSRDGLLKTFKSFK
jgi:nucleoside-diphosphate-sugar epimerase